MSTIRYSIFAALDFIRKSDLFTNDLEKLHPADMAAIHAALSRVENFISARKKAIAKHLATIVAEQGTTGPKGHVTLELPTAEVIHELRTASVPDFDGLQALVLESGLPISAVFDEVKVLEANPSKLEHAIATGKLNKEEVEALRKKTRALKVKPTTVLASVLQEALPS